MDIPQSGWKILSVVGEEGDFTIIRDLLADAIPGGFELSRASDTAGALEALDRLSPDVLLVDSVLSGGESGLDCLRVVRERARHIPVVLLGDGVETGGDQAAADDYVDKRQMSAPLLGRVIRYAVERRQILARLDAANAALLRDETGRPTGIASVNRDITQRQQAEESLRLLNKRLEAQAGLSHKLGEANLETTRILDILAGWVADLIGDTCIVFRLVEDGQALVPVACHHRDGASDRVLQQVVRAYPQQISALLPKTIQESALIPVISIQEFTEKVDPVLRPYIDRFGPNSILLVPVSIHGRLTGSISMTRDVTNTPYTSEDLYFLEALAGMAALWIANADLYQAVQVELSERRRVEGELNEIQRRLIDGAESERLSLSRELHDGPIQDLYVIGMQLRQINKAGMTADVVEMLLALQESVQHMIDTLRAMTMELRPPALTRFGLEPAIRSHIEQVRKMQPALEIQLDLDREGGYNNPALGLSERLRLTLYRIYQVAITNVVRHAQAQRVSIRLRINPSDVLLEVEDDGRGFQMPERWVDLARQGHLGLVGGVERVEALGGTLQVISAPGEGTLLRVILPRGEGLLMDG